MVDEASDPIEWVHLACGHVQQSSIIGKECPGCGVVVGPEFTPDTTLRELTSRLKELPEGHMYLAWALTTEDGEPFVHLSHRNADGGEVACASLRVVDPA